MQLRRHARGPDIWVVETSTGPFYLPRPGILVPSRPALPDSLIVEPDYGENIIVRSHRDKVRLVRKRVALLKKAIKKGGFAKVQIMLGLENIPVGGCGKVKRKVKEWGFDRATSVHNAIHVVVMTNRIAFVDTLTALTVSHDFPRRQQFHEQVTFFHDHHGRMCHVVISDNEGARELLIDYVDMHYRYDLDTRFLTIVQEFPKP